MCWQMLRLLLSQGIFPMAETVLQIDPRDNVLVALAPLAAGTVPLRPAPAADSCPVAETIPAKHKLALST